MRQWIIAAAMLSVATSASAEATWLDSWNAASKMSKQTGRPILMLFTGSDWCPPCKMLESQIFHTPVFEAWAKQHVVLLRLDFPRFHPQPADVKAANMSLNEKYAPTGFPTVIFATPRGAVLGRLTGFGGGGPSFWTKNAEYLIRAHSGGK